MCPPEIEQKKMSFARCRKHLAETRKGHLEKSNFYTWEDDVVHAKIFFFHYVDRNCEKCLKHGKQSCSNDNWRWHELKTKIEEIASRAESIKTEEEAGITAKNSDQEVKLRDNIEDQEEAGFLPQLISHLWLLCQATWITSGNFLSSYASRGPWQWCFWVLCWCSLQRNQTLMGTWAGSRGYFIFDSILYWGQKCIFGWAMMPSCILFPINSLKKVI